MKTKKLLNIVLTEEEVKEAVWAYLFTKVGTLISPKHLEHMVHNNWIIDYEEGSNYIVMVDGYLEE